MTVFYQTCADGVRESGPWLWSWPLSFLQPRLSVGRSYSDSGHRALSQSCSTAAHQVLQLRLQRIKANRCLSILYSDYFADHNQNSSVDDIEICSPSCCNHSRYLTNLSRRQPCSLQALAQYTMRVDMQAYTYPNVAPSSTSPSAHIHPDITTNHFCSYI